MKKTALLYLSLAFGSAVFAQGKFVSDTYKPLIGATWKVETDLPLLEGFEYRGGSMLSNFDDPEQFGTNWYIKGTTALVLVEQVTDDNVHEIIDVLEVKDVKKNQVLKSGDCTDGDSEVVSLIVLVTSSEAERWKAIKAWNFNRDKRRIEVYSATRVSCVGMGEEY